MIQLRSILLQVIRSNDFIIESFHCHNNSTGRKLEHDLKDLNSAFVTSLYLSIQLYMCRIPETPDEFLIKTVAIIAYRGGSVSILKSIS